MPSHNNISLIINNKTFIEMGEITKLNPAHQMGGVKNHVHPSYLSI